MAFKNKFAPGILTDLEGIPTATVNNHNESFYYCRSSGIRNATLFHVDAHSDMLGIFRSDKVLSGIYHAEDYKFLSIENFICPAVYWGVVSSIYWLNPHSQERRLQELGRKSEELCVVSNNGGGYNTYGWGRNEHDLTWGIGKIIAAENLSISRESPLILDVDLDAFCCSQNQNHTLPYLSEYRLTYDGVSGFRRRIDESIEVLANLQKPDLITIATSQNDGKINCFVPPSMVDDVLKNLTSGLRRLYGGMNAKGSKK